MNPAQLKLLAAQLRAGDQRAIRRVLAALNAHGGNVTRAARALGISRNTLTHWRTASDLRCIPALVPASPGTPGRRAEADYYVLLWVDPPDGYECTDTRAEAIALARAGLPGVELTCDRNGRIADSEGRARARVAARMVARPVITREQVPGWDLWLEQRADGGHVVDVRGEPRCLPLPTRVMSYVKTAAGQRHCQNLSSAAAGHQCSIPAPPTRVPASANAGPDGARSVRESSLGASANAENGS